MPATMILATLMMAQSPAITVERTPDVYEIGYRELQAGRPQAAIERIAGNAAVAADDPAAMINRGTAQARLGDSNAALASYRTALGSRDRYDLELADGTWMDSRAAARLAIRMLAQGQALALR